MDWPAPPADNRLDVVSIDVEGNEPSVLQGFSVAIWKPRIVSIEDNSFGRNPAVPSWFAQHRHVRFKRTGVHHWCCGSDDAQLNRRRYRLAARIAAAAARTYGAVSGGGRLRADHSATEGSWRSLADPERLPKCPGPEAVQRGGLTMPTQPATGSVVVGPRFCRCSRVLVVTRNPRCKP